MENYVDQYFSFVIDLLGQIAKQSEAAIHKTAEVVATAIEHGGLFLLFGSGQSALLARDAAYRAGGLAPAMALEDIADGDAERLEGLAKFIIARYELRANDVIAIISNSGINPVPIEMAMLARDAGLTVIAITSMTHSQAVPSRHSSGKKLYELADIVIDSRSVPGDAAIQLPESTLKSGATSTVVGSAILQAITVQVAAMLSARGHEPPVWVSSNLPNGEIHNNELLTRYRSHLARYQMASLSSTARKGNQI